MAVSTNLLPLLTLYAPRRPKAAAVAMYIQSIRPYAMGYFYVVMHQKAGAQGPQAVGSHIVSVAGGGILAGRRDLPYPYFRASCNYFANLSRIAHNQNGNFENPEYSISGNNYSEQIPIGYPVSINIRYWVSTTPG